ncbi:hypothetical protein MHH37_15610 [Solibacillus sp. FSL K6-1781]|uniref:hypothetical protein n=1 Tax=Solibacillus sp. FSL K6-1781 TaxID=2921474 RepID=UPI00315AA6C7
MQVGNRIYHNQKGEILFMSGEMDNGVARPKDEEVSWIDIPYGFDFTKQIILSIDVETKQPVIELTNYETPEEKRIRELEDALLLQAENEVGGIL